MSTSLGVSRRELAKSGRRERIVDATTALLRETGIDALSVAQIAEKAKVSPATVYNLFGTKSAILQQVFDRDLRDYERLVERARARDALDRIFKAVAIAASVYGADPDFYRAMAHGGRRGDNLYSSVSELRIGFWQRAVARARTDGQLRADANDALLGVALSQIMRGAFYEWAAESISAERLAQEVAYGFVLALINHATEHAAAALRAELCRLEEKLAVRSRHNEPPSDARS